jgi:hypothetical protein
MIGSTIDYSRLNRPTINTPSKEYKELSNSVIVHEAINVISANPQFSDIDKDIIYSNIMDGTQSINALSIKYNIPVKDLNKRKRKLISEFKTIFAEKYNIKSLSDII